MPKLRPYQSPGIFNLRLWIQLQDDAGSGPNVDRNRTPADGTVCSESSRALLFADRPFRRARGKHRSRVESLVVLDLALAWCGFGLFVVVTATPRQRVFLFVLLPLSAIILSGPAFYLLLAYGNAWAMHQGRAPV